VVGTIHGNKTRKSTVKELRECEELRYMSQFCYVVMLRRLLFTVSQLCIQNSDSNSMKAVIYKNVIEMR
jgi:hypothetical protein